MAQFFSPEIAEWLEADEDGHEHQLDQLFAAASDVYEATAVCESDSQAPVPAPALHQCTSSTSSTPPRSNYDYVGPSCSMRTVVHTPKPRFAAPKTDTEIIEARKAGVPKKTIQDTNYCKGVWDEWSKCREQSTGISIAPLCELTTDELQHWLTRFVLEARKNDGTVYPPNTLHHLCCGLMRHLRWNGKPQLDLFKDSHFADFRASLDSEMKRLQSEGVGSKRRQAEVFTEEEENTLWEKGLLGEKTPQSLLDTMVFCCGLYFALRSGKEHRQLRQNPCQIQLVERIGERAYLKYTEDVSKNHPGGLKGTPKVVLHHSNPHNPQRCFVRLFKLYCQLCPHDAPANAFYLRPALKPTKNCWYSKFPLGHTTLANTVSRLCKLGGITGYKTNHSLRATATSRLYQSGVDEQLVMERTGHRSLEGVGSYKRTSNVQREALSDILNNSKRPRQTTPSRSLVLSENTVAVDSQHSCPNSAVTEPSRSIAVSNSQHHQQLLSGLSLPSAVFTNCTVNFYIGSKNTGTDSHGKQKRRAAIIDSDSD